MTRQLFFVREKKTETWCTSSKHGSFSDSFESAVIFLNRRNAEKAIKDMKTGIDPKTSTCPHWDAKGVRYTPSLEHVYEWSSYLVPDFEIVAYNLVPE